MTTNDHANDSSERKLGPWLMVFTTLQFGLAFVAEYCGRQGWQPAAIYLIVIPPATTFLATLVLCCLYTRGCHKPHAMSYYLMSIVTAMLVPGTILVLTASLIRLLPT